MTGHSAEVAGGERFRFGANWARFLKLINPERIAVAERSLTGMFGLDTFAGRTFLDVGCGSGVFSLAARRLGARVHSFDYDPDSVACARELRRQHFPDDPDWEIEEGSVLDLEFVRGLGRFDLVYSWGVLHHTGDMHRALEHVLVPVEEDGLLFVALYNDQGWRSTMWRQVKRFYCKGGRLGRAAVLSTFFPLLTVHGAAIDLISRNNPIERYRRHKQERGMSLHVDWVDWLGGYPYEVATPEHVVAFFRSRGWELARFNPNFDMGCNEFVFARDPRDPPI